MKTSSGRESVRQRFNGFAIATIVVGVGLLAVAWPAAAEIVYTPADIRLKKTVATISTSTKMVSPISSFPQVNYHRCALLVIPASMTLLRNR